MKHKPLLGSLLILIIFCISSFLWAEEYDFRKVKWGMSKQEVLASETIKPAAQFEEGITYLTKVLNKHVGVVYRFVQNKLFSGGYILDEEHSNYNDFINDYKDFKKILTKKYGQPNYDRVFWYNDLHKDAYKNWGLAVSIGHLEYISRWDTASTRILCSLKGDNFKIGCIVDYNSKALMPLEIKQKEKKALDAF